ncbi:MAG TPA: 23S rRNA (uracil(1939)-C(5))-methyltransferase RlmD [bacterium]
MTDRLTLERFAAQGRAIARVDGKAVLVDRGIAGETVEVEVTQAEARFLVARVVDVVTPSPDRVEPPCPHFAGCGGCDWQHVRYPAQVALKRQVVQEQLERLGGLTPPTDWAITPAVQPLEYRDKLEWVPVPTDAGWTVGFHGHPKADPVAVQRCWLGPETFSAIAHGAMAFLVAQAPRAPDKPIPPFGVTRLTVQGGHDVNGATAYALTLHVRGAKQVDAIAAIGTKLRERVRRDVPALTTVAVSAGDDAERAGMLRVASGDGALYRHVGALRYPVPLDAFFQVNPEQAQGLVAYVSDQFARHLPAKGAPRVFDLFCGAGLFTIPLLQAGYTVAGAEVSRAAIKSAGRVAQAVDVTSDGFRVMDLDRPEALRNLVREFGHPAAILVDPPRRGLAPRLAADLVTTAPSLLVYVSCDPGTFARDAKKLAERFTLAELRGFDVFPQTHHLELVGTFLRRQGT